MTIRNIAHHQPSFAAAARLNRTAPRKSPPFSIQDHLSQTPSARSAERQSIGAAPAERQLSAADATINDTAAKAQPFFVVNPSYDSADPASPSMIQDPSATATPQKVVWTSSNGLTTTGIMNPFGLTRNDPSIGFFGIPSNRTS